MNKTSNLSYFEDMDLIDLMTERKVDGRTLQRRTRLPASRLISLSRATATRIHKSEVAIIAAALDMDTIEFMLAIDVEDEKVLDWQEQGYLVTMGQMIRAAREKSFYSQSALAAVIKRSSGWLSQVETDRVQCAAKSLVLIARALEVPVKSLVPLGLKKQYNVAIDNFLTHNPHLKDNHGRKNST